MQMYWGQYDPFPVTGFGRGNGGETSVKLARLWNCTGKLLGLEVAAWPSHSNQSVEVGFVFHMANSDLRGLCPVSVVGSVALDDPVRSGCLRHNGPCGVGRRSAGVRHEGPARLGGDN